MSKDLVSEKEEIQCKNIIKRYEKSSILMVLQKNPQKDHDINWPQIPNHSYRILITGDSASGKTNKLFNLISQQQDIDNIYLHARDPFEAQHHFLNNKRESTG